MLGMSLSAKSSPDDPNRIKPHAAVYPWERWFRRKQVTLRHGRDFHCTIGGMIINIRQAAKRHGLRVAIKQTWSPDGRGEITVSKVGERED